MGVRGDRVQTYSPQTLSSVAGRRLSAIKVWLTPTAARVPLAHALLERSHQPDWLFVFLEKIRESLVGELLKARASVVHNGLDSLPGLVIELNALAHH